MAEVLLDLLQTPQPDGLVMTAAGKRLAIRGEGESGDRSLVPQERTAFLALEPCPLIG